MWIFTKYGFFSVVCARKGNGEHGQPVDPNRMMMRARAQSHLEALRKRFPVLLGQFKVETFTGSDYPFRYFIPKGVWIEILSELAAETDYDNFKSEVARHQGNRGAAYLDSLHEVWSLMNQPEF